MYNHRFRGTLPIRGRISTARDRTPPAQSTTDRLAAKTPGPPAPTLRGALRALRANTRYRLGKALTRVLAARSYSARLEPRDIRSVLIVRINARMGNTVFLTPLLGRLQELMPFATIDLACAYPHASGLIGPLPGVRRVVTFPYKGAQLPWRYWVALRRLRAQRYDLVIDPTPNSTGARLVLMLAHARFRLGYASDNQWAPLTHAVPLPQQPLHQAMQPVYLLSEAVGAPVDPGTIRLALALTPHELASGRAAIAAALRERAGLAVGFFGHATGAKRIPPGYWRAFWDAFLALEPQAVPVEFLPSPASPPVEARSVALHFPAPRELAAAIAATSLFISADAGPMHLAGSTPVATVALFRASDPLLYGPLKGCDLALDATQLSPHAVAERCSRLWRAALRA
ncbi:MAG TPA: glycosyltransferase family 9 protein [Steroidobacteraceae bacterium]|nr:glycosyltransferase family 9 protein [Steroidobacteraceae bacterium]